MACEDVEGRLEVGSGVPWMTVAPGEEKNWRRLRSLVGCGEKKNHNRLNYPT